MNVSRLELLGSIKSNVVINWNWKTAGTQISCRAIKNSTNYEQFLSVDRKLEDDLIQQKKKLFHLFMLWRQKDWFVLMGLRDSFHNIAHKAKFIPSSILRHILLVAHIVNKPTTFSIISSSSSSVLFSAHTCWLSLFWIYGDVMYREMRIVSFSIHIISPDVCLLAPVLILLPSRRLNTIILLAGCYHSHRLRW